MKSLKTTTLALVMSCLSPAILFAATDGSLGATSTGTSEITVEIDEMVRITGVQDLDAGTYNAPGAAGLDLNEDVCIYTNDPDGQYKVTATGDGGGGTDFTITDGASTIAYAVKWNNTTGEGNNALTTNTLSAAFDNASATYPCTVDNANFNVEMTHNNIMSVPAGIYTGTLTLVIEPDATN